MTRRLHKLFLLLALCAFGVLAKAQERYLNVNQELKSMSLGSYPSFSVTVEEADEKLAVEQWKTYLKEYGAKTKKSKPESLKAEGVTINSIGGANLLNVYTDFEQRGTELKVYLWVSEGGDFISSSSNLEDVEAIENLLREFALLLRRAAVTKELTVEQKELEVFQKKLDGLAKDIVRSEKEIEAARKTITKAEAAIERDRASSVTTQAEIDKQTEAVKVVAEKLAGIQG